MSLTVSAWIILIFIGLAVLWYKEVLQKERKQMSAITDAVASNTIAVTNLTQVSSDLNTNVTAAIVAITSLQQQVANDDTAGNAAAASELATSTAALTQVAATLQAGLAQLQAVLPSTSAPAASGTQG